MLLAGNLVTMTSDDHRTSLFALLKERYQILVNRREGLPRPWTDDVILQRNKFCNVFREDDKTTQWFRENMRNENFYGDNWEAILLTCIAFRWFNKIEIGEILLDPSIGLSQGAFYEKRAEHLIMGAYPEGPFVTAAYVIKGPNGMKKLEGILYCISCAAKEIKGMARRLKSSQEADGVSMKRAWMALQELECMGPFNSYEVVTDLYYTPVLAGAWDQDEWANPGPGAARGISRILYGDAEKLNPTSHRDQAVLIAEMKNLLALSKEQHSWIHEMPERPFHLREVEHILCEYDKYLRVAEGGRMKQKYNGESENGPSSTRSSGTRFKRQIEFQKLMVEKLGPEKTADPKGRLLSLLLDVFALAQQEDIDQASILDLLENAYALGDVRSVSAGIGFVGLSLLSYAATKGISADQAEATELEVLTGAASLEEKEDGDDTVS